MSFNVKTKNKVEMDWAVFRAGIESELAVARFKNTVPEREPRKKPGYGRKLEPHRRGRRR